MELMGEDEKVLCQAFSTTLRKTTRDWYNKLPPRFIYSFKQLVKDFIQQFVASRRKKKKPTSLMGIIYGKMRPSGLILKGLRVDNNLNLTNDVRHPESASSLFTKPSSTLDALMTRTARYMNIEKGQNFRRERKAELRDDQQQ